MKRRINTTILTSFFLFCTLFGLSTVTLFGDAAYDAALKASQEAQEKVKITFAKRVEANIKWGGSETINSVADAQELLKKRWDSAFHGSLHTVDTGPYERATSHPDFTFPATGKGGFICWHTNVDHHVGFTFKETEGIAGNQEYKDHIQRTYITDKEFVIREYKGDSAWKRAPLITENRPNRMFWVTYDKGEIMIGSGREPGLKPALHHPYVMDKRHAVKSYGFHGTGGNGARAVQSQGITFHLTDSLRAAIGKRSARLNGIGSGYLTHPSWKLPDEGAGVIYFTSKSKALAQIGFAQSYHGDDQLKQPEHYISSIGNFDISNKTITIKTAFGEKTYPMRDHIGSEENLNKASDFWAVFDHGMFQFGAGKVAGRWPYLNHPIFVGNSYNARYFGFAGGGGTDYTNISIEKLTPELRYFIKMQATPGMEVYGTPDGYYRSDHSFTLPAEDSGVLYFETDTEYPEVSFGSELQSHREWLILKDGSRTYWSDEGKSFKVRQPGGATDSIPTVQVDRSSKKFWILAHNGRYMIGAGDVAGKNPILSKPYTAPQKNVKYFGFHGDKRRYFNIRTEKPSTKLASSLFASEITTTQSDHYITNPAWKLPVSDEGVVIYTSSTMYAGISFGKELNTNGTLKQLYRSSGFDTNPYLWFADRSNGEQKVTHHEPLQRYSATEMKQKTTFWTSFNHGKLMWGIGENPGENVLFAKQIQLTGNTTGTQFFGFDGENRTYSNIRVEKLSPQVKEKLDGLGTTYFPIKSKFVAPEGHGKYFSDSSWKLPEKNRGVLKFACNHTLPHFAFGDKAPESNGLFNPQQRGWASHDDPITFMMRDTDSQGTDHDTKQTSVIPKSKVSEGRQYWVAYDNGKAYVGIGSEVGKNLFVPAPYIMSQLAGETTYFGLGNYGKSHTYTGVQVQALTTDLLNRIKAETNKMTVTHAWYGLAKGDKVTITESVKKFVADQKTATIAIPDIEAIMSSDEQSAAEELPSSGREVRIGIKTQGLSFDTYGYRRNIRIHPLAKDEPYWYSPLPAAQAKAPLALTYTLRKQKRGSQKIILASAKSDAPLFTFELDFTNKKATLFNKFGEVLKTATSAELEKEGATMRIAYSNNSIALRVGSSTILEATGRAEGTEVGKIGFINTSEFPQVVCDFVPQFESSDDSAITVRDGNDQFPIWKDKWKLSATNKGAVQWTTDTSAPVGIALSHKKDDVGYTVSVSEKVVTIKKAGTLVKQIAGEFLLLGTNNLWLTYNNGIIALGRSKIVGENSLVHWKDMTPLPNIDFYSFTNRTGKTSISKISSESLSTRSTYRALETEKSFTWVPDWNVEKTGAFTFQAKSDNGFTVALLNSNTLATRELAPYRIVLEREQAYIYKQSFLQDESKTPAIFSKTPASTEGFRQYWGSYKDGVIKLGAGTIIDLNTIIEWKDPSPLQARFFTFSSPGEYRGIKLAVSEDVSEYQHKEFMDSYLFKPGWRIKKKNRGLIRFAAQPLAQTSTLDVAFLTLAEQHLSSKAGAPYRVVISQAGSAIYKKSKRLGANGPGHPLSPGSKQRYWAYFNNGTISIGSGDELDKNIILTRTDPDFAPTAEINFFSVGHGVHFTHIKASELIETLAEKTKRETAEQAAAEKAQKEKAAQEAAEKAVAEAAEKRALTMSAAQAITADPKNFAANSTGNRFLALSQLWQFPAINSGILKFKATTKHGDKTADQYIHVGFVTNRTEGILPLTGAEYGISLAFPTSADKKNQLLFLKNGQAVHSVTLANGPENTDYWVSIENGVFTVGTGALPGFDVVGSWTEPEMKSHLRFFSFGSNSNNVTLTNITASRNRVSSAYHNEAKLSSYEFHPEWKLKEANRGVATFQALGHQEMHIVFDSARRVKEIEKQSDTLYRAVIGAWGNTGSALYRGDSQEPVATSQTALPTDGKYHQYWALYDRGRIAIGTGTVVGKGVILDWTDPEIETTRKEQVIDLFAFSSQISYQKIKSVEIIDVSSFYQKDNTGTYPFNKHWKLKQPRRGAISFKARGPQNLHVVFDSAALETLPSQAHAAYRVIYGGWGNTASAIYKKSQYKEYKRGLKIPADGKFHPYWALFDNGVISFGTGLDYTDEKSIIMSWTDPDAVAAAADPNSQPIEYFSFSPGIEYTDITSHDLTVLDAQRAEAEKARLAEEAKNKAAADAAAQAAQEKERLKTIYNDPEVRAHYFFNPDWKLNGPNSGVITFKAKGNQPLHVVLNSAEATAHTKKEQAVYRMALGEWGNTGSTIYKGSRTISEATNQSVLPTDSQFHDYWVSYNNGSMKLGYGTIVGVNIALSWTDPTPPQQPLTHFSFSSGNEYTDITSRPFVDSTRYFSPHDNGRYEFRGAWRLPEINKGAITFKAQSRQNLHVAFITAKARDGITQADAPYRIIYGSWGNTASAIYRKNANKLHTKDVRIASGNSFAEYWASYSNGVVSFGTGSDIGNPDTLLMTWQDKTPLSGIEYFSFSPGSQYRDIKTHNLTEIEGALARAAEEKRTQASRIATGQIGTSIDQYKETAFSTMDAYLDKMTAIMRAKRSRDKAVNVTFDPIDYLSYIDGLEFAVANRHQMSKTKQTALAALIKTTMFTSGFYRNAQHTPRLAALQKQLSEPFNITKEVEAYITDFEKIIVDNSGPESFARKHLFSRLKSLTDHVNTIASNETVALIQNSLVDPISQGEFTSAEKDIVIQLAQALEDAKAGIERRRLAAEAKRKEELIRSNTMTLRVARAQKTVGFHEYVQELEQILKDLEAGSLRFDESDYVGFAQEIARVFNEREQLTPTQMKTFVSLISRAYKIPGFASQKTVLYPLYKDREQPITFNTRLVKYSAELDDLLLNKPDASSPQRVRYFAKLSRILTAPGEQSLTDLEALVALVGKVQANDFTPQEKASAQTVLLPAQSKIKEIKTKQAATAAERASFSYNLDLAKKQPTYGQYIESLKTLLRNVSGGIITLSASEKNSFAQELVTAVENQEQLDEAGTVSLQQVVYYGMVPLGSEHKAALTSAYKKIETPVSQKSFADRVAQYRKEIQTIAILGPDTSKRKWYIAKLSKLLSAPGTQSKEDLTILNNEIIIPLINKKPSESERAILEPLGLEVQSRLDAAAKKQATLTYHLDLLYEAVAGARTEMGAQFIARTEEIIKQKTNGTITSGPTDGSMLLQLIIQAVNGRDIFTDKQLPQLSQLVQAISALPALTPHAATLTRLSELSKKQLAFTERVNRLVLEFKPVAALEKQYPKNKMRHAWFIRSLEQIFTADGTRSLADLKELSTALLQPLAKHGQFSAEEKALLDPVTKQAERELVSKSAEVMTLDYNLRELDRELAERAESLPSGSLSILSKPRILGLYKILQRKGKPSDQGGISFKSETNDYQRFIGEISRIVSDRELLHDGDRVNLVNLIKTTGVDPHFAPFAQTQLKQLEADASEKLTFAHRVAKYKTRFTEVSALPEQDMRRKQFFSMFKTVMDAPGEITEEDLSTLEKQLIAPVTYGNFTSAEKALIKPIQEEINRARRELSTYSYHRERLNAHKTEEEYLTAFEAIARQIQQGKILFEAAEERTLAGEDGDLATMIKTLPFLSKADLANPEKNRSVIRARGIIQQIYYSNRFGKASSYGQRMNRFYNQTRVALETVNAERIEATVRERINRYASELQSLPQKESEAGKRARFFERLERFARFLAQPQTKLLSGDTVKQALEELKRVTEVFVKSPQLSSDEQTTVHRLQEALTTAHEAIEQAKQASQAAQSGPRIIKSVGALGKANGTYRAYNPRTRAVRRRRRRR